MPTTLTPQAFAAPEPVAAPEPAATGLTLSTDSSEHMLAGADGGFGGTPDADEADDERAAALAGDAEVEDALDLELEIDQGRAEEDPVEAVKEPTGGYASLERLSSFGRRGTEDNLLGDADRLVEEDEDVAPKVSRGLGLSPMGKSGGGGGSGSGSSGGATLFERMANLSRGGRQAGVEEEEPADDPADNGGSLNIPRFLGRQNNQ